MHYIDGSADEDHYQYSSHNVEYHGGIGLNHELSECYHLEYHLIIISSGGTVCH